jgi:YjbE family integral membrane protein
MLDFSASGPLVALFQVLMIDLVLAGDNAVAVGLAAAGLEKTQRKKAILLGLAVAVVLRIGFALITTKLLGIVGLLFAGGILLLWVCWKMWRELREQPQQSAAEAALESAAGADNRPGFAAPTVKAKTFATAFTQILVADISMSLDNVLAVAGAAREHPAVLIVGLLMSIVLMGVAATWIAKLLNKHRWIGYVGLVIVLYVSLHMMWEGHRSVVMDLGRTGDYNAVMPDPLDISPRETAEHLRHKPPTT